MKRNRLISLAFIIAAAVFASFFGGSFSYALFYAAIAVPLTCLIYIICVYLQLKIYQAIDSKIVVKGDKVGYRYILANESLFHFAVLRTEFLTDYSQVDTPHTDESLSLAPSCRAERETQLTCLYRGEYVVGVKSVMISDYLGLFRLRRRYPSVMNLRVYPRVVNLASLAALRFGDDVKSLPYTQGGQEADNQPHNFMFGDNVRSVNWKVSARSGMQELYVRRRTEPPKERIAIYLDTTFIDSDERIKTEDKILETALAIAAFYADRSIETEIIYFSDKLNRINIHNREDFTGFYNSCLHLHFTGEEPVLENITGINATVLIVISSQVRRFAEPLNRFSELMSTCLILTGNREHDELSVIRESLGKTKLIHIPEDAGVGTVLDKSHDL